jgi:hypothetical protein
MCVPYDPPHRCFLGTLEGAEPAIDVWARMFPTTESDSGATWDGPGVDWSWWTGPDAVSGILVLSVAENGQVDFIGPVRQADAGLSWTVAGAELAIESVEPEQVILVDGWLDDTPAGEVRFCPAMPFPDPALDGLPSRFCAATDSLGSQATGDGELPREPFIWVQEEAADQFGTDGEATYAISPRLYGGGCAGQPPCWFWDVVARVDDALTPEIEPSPSPTSSLTAVGTDRAEAGGALFVLTVTADRTEYVAGDSIDVSSVLRSEDDVTVNCLWQPIISLEQLDGDLRFSPGPFIMSCPGERDLQSGEEFANGFLPAVWGLLTPNPLDPYIRDGKLYLPPGTYRFSAHSSLNVGGLDQFGQHPVRLEAAVVIHVTPESPPSEAFDCSETVSILMDNTGLVEACSAWTPEPGQSGVSPGPDASSVFVAWTYSYCRGAPFARFEHDGDRYVFELGHLVTLPMPTPSCEPVTRTVGIAVRFKQPLDAGLIDAVSEP